MPSAPANDVVRLSDYLLMLRRHWRVVTACLVVGVALAGVHVQFAPREYTSSTSVLVTATTPEAGTTGARATGINLDTEAQLVTSTEMVTAAATLLDLDSTELGDLAARVTVTVPPNTEILTIGFLAPSARAAQDGAQAFARAYLDGRRGMAQASLDAELQALQDRVEAVTAQIEQIATAGERLPEGSPQQLRNEERLANLGSQVAALTSQQDQLRAAPVTPGRVITEAPRPASPSSPDPVVSLTAGVLLGLLVGLALATVRYRADDCIHTPADLERRTGTAVLAALTDPVDDRDVRLVSAFGADTRAYGRLRNAVTAGLEGSRNPVIVVAGTRRGGGPVAANLAASLARLGEDVFLVCADVYGTTAAALLGTAPAVGLAEVLSGERTVEQAARRLPGLSTLRILGTGGDAQRADALLHTKNLRSLVDSLVRTSAFVVVESPPTASSPAAQAIAPASEAAVLVVEQGATTARDVTDALEQFAVVRRQVLGAVVGAYRPVDGNDSSAGAAAHPDAVRAPVPSEAPPRARTDAALR